MSDAPLLNPQLLGQAEAAHRALLQRVLAPAGLSHAHWVALNLLVARGNQSDWQPIAAALVDTLKIEYAEAHETLAGLVDAGLLTAGSAPPARARLTEVGQQRHSELRGEVARVVARLYRDLPAQDLATAGRVLATLTLRASAELRVIDPP